MEILKKSSVLPRSFFEVTPEKVARRLLGKVLVHCSPEGTTAGIIIETEAYYQGDPACHATRGKTKGNASMFGSAGTAYVYFVYGNHFCFNAVTGREGEGEAVLVRALEPLEGLELMQKRRGANCSRRKLSSGPGNLCSAMGINREHDGISLQEDPLFIIGGEKEIPEEELAVTSRVGISKGKELLLRYYWLNHPYVSRR